MTSALIKGCSHKEKDSYSRPFFFFVSCSEDIKFLSFSLVILVSVRTHIL